ncbi:hypothetical protein POM88_043872 [Heracleum sosnowskyi]|uniref:Uncharacterized protein n=1 Tax=Heracleum sosnowskyi TaxID=360622 RepID=A0AAD8H452_9APIA|nr:hypothetical protein POM88_043872 [Heracleum sosnowskyi]
MASCMFSFDTVSYYENDTDADVEDGGTFRAVDFVNAVKSVTLSQMEAALKALQCDLAKTSTGKACLGMADHIFVETNGVKIPMSEMAAVSFYDRRLNPHILSITPHDPNVLTPFIFNVIAYI